MRQRGIEQALGILHRAARQPGKRTHVTRPVTLIVAPYDAGHRNTRMGAGPTALIDHGLINQLSAHGIEAQRVDVRLDPNVWHTELHTGFHLHRLVKQAAAEHIARGSIPVLLAGNCNTFIGLVAAHQAHGTDPAVLWLDAHADFHTPATDTFGSLDCQGLSMLTGRAWTTLTSKSSEFQPVDDRSVALIGARWIDEAEGKALGRSAIHQMSVDAAKDADARRHVFRQLAATMKPLHVHIDADVLDPQLAPANDYAVPGGLDANGLQTLLSDALTLMPLASLSIASYDPRQDTHGTLRMVLSDTICRVATNC